MEGEEIGMFLARASEMRSKFSECIDRCGGDKRRREEEIEEDEAEDIGEEEEEEEEEGSLGNIRDVFESLENQLSSLQVPSSHLSSIYLFLRTLLFCIRVSLILKLDAFCCLLVPLKYFIISSQCYCRGTIFRWKTENMKQL
ncbi:uncharacterized protein M6B38_374515 [Iris pallida]|uniref:Uncharacterized protein n=1 Tax=Iris pallida TaxID=29817 RepID=A0AAX6GBB0_IRIPA|nr:uncharacterized protein M6B38_374515 [Iris pallida]